MPRPERTKVETADENHSKIHQARSLQSEANNAESKNNNSLFANKDRMKAAFNKSEKSPRQISKTEATTI
jgi:hypothetical protein